MDIVFLTFPAFSNPVLLQRILQAMEDPHSPRQAALNYAILALVVRLVRTQSGVFTLWYGRRAYERSRGELILMLYMKTLSRKVVSVSSKAIIEVDCDGSNSNQKGLGWFRRSLRLLMNPIHRLCGTRQKKPDKKDLATMGKIMNLMR